MRHWKLLMNRHRMTCLFYHILLEEDSLMEMLDDLVLTKVVDSDMLLLEELSGTECAMRIVSRIEAIYL